MFGVFLNWELYAALRRMLDDGDWVRLLLASSMGLRKRLRANGIGRVEWWGLLRIPLRAIV